MTDTCTIEAAEARIEALRDVLRELVEATEEFIGTLDGERWEDLERLEEEALPAAWRALESEDE